MTRSRRAAALAGLVAVAGLAAACGGNGGNGSGSDVTLPSSLSITTTVPGSPTTVDPSPTTTKVPPTSPAADGAPIIRSLQAEPGAATCANGSIPVTVTFTVDPQPPVRVFSVFLDGAPAGSANTPDPVRIAAVACDGRIHSVLLIATGPGGTSSTQAVAFRAPGPT